MTQVSKHKLNKQVYEKIFSLFPQFLGRLSRKGHQQLIFDALFSRTEQTMVAKRIAIAFMLVKGCGYAEISSKLKVSYGTVAKIAEILKNSSPEFVKELNLIAKDDAFSDFLNTIGYKLSVAMPPKGGNWSVWRRRIEKERREGTQPF